MTKFEMNLEIVKTLAIVLGVGIAINELFIKNISYQRTVASYTQRLIEMDTTGPMVQATRDFSRIYFETVVSDGGVITAKDAWDLDQATIPQFRVFVAWESCFEAELCDEDLGLRYICNRAQAYKKLRTLLREFVPFDDSISNSLFFALIERCDSKA